MSLPPSQGHPNRLPLPSGFPFTPSPRIPLAPRDNNSTSLDSTSGADRTLQLGATPGITSSGLSMFQLLNGARGDLGMSSPSVSSTDNERTGTTALSDDGLPDDALSHIQNTIPTPVVPVRRNREEDENTPGADQPNIDAFIDRHLAKKQFKSEDLKRRAKQEAAEFASYTVKEQNVLLFLAIRGHGGAAAGVSEMAGTMAISGFDDCVKKIRVWAQRELFDPELPAYVIGLTERLAEAPAFIPREHGLPNDFLTNKRYEKERASVHSNISDALSGRRHTLKNALMMSMNLNKDKPSEIVDLDKFMKETVKSFSKTAAADPKVATRMAWLRYVTRHWEVSASRTFKRSRGGDGFWQYVDEELAEVKNMSDLSTEEGKMRLAWYFKNIMDEEQKWYAAAVAAAAAAAAGAADA